jgi:hypothetical protein
VVFAASAEESLPLGFPLIEHIDAVAVLAAELLIRSSLKGLYADPEPEFLDRRDSRKIGKTYGSRLRRRARGAFSKLVA